MRLDHKKIREIICSEFDLWYYIQWKFTYFYKKDYWYKNEVWYIEQIPAWKYLKTLLVRFFWLLDSKEIDNERCSRIEKKIEELYTEQRKWKPIERCLDRWEKQIIF